MLMDIIEKNSEDALLQFVERNHKQGSLASLVHFQFSQQQMQPGHDDFVLAIKECLIGFRAAVYFCGDGDVFVVWRGTTRTVLKQMLQQIQKSFAHDLPHRYYDLLAHGEELRIICKQKLQSSAPPEPHPAETILSASGGAAANWESLQRPIEPKLRFSAEQIVNLAQAAEKRRDRKTPVILVVEDQTFSRLLLHSSLRESYDVHSTEQAKDAIQLYAQHAPDIVFLDIELPDGSGHQLAELFRRFDPKAFVAMVTAYNQHDEVMRARDNGARAFVIKPYNKQKIFDCIQLYYRNHKKPH
jgi:two-component system, chemotaxis family, chemotaxis protein CheY